VTYTMFLVCKKCNERIIIGEYAPSDVMHVADLVVPTAMLTCVDYDAFLFSHWPHADDKANAFEVKIEETPNE